MKGRENRLWFQVRWGVGDPLPNVVPPTFANSKGGAPSVILDMLSKKTWGDSPLTGDRPNWTSTTN